MSEIKSMKEHYTGIDDFYIEPKTIKAFTSNKFDYDLYNTAHCLVSERHEKSDLTELVFYLLNEIKKLRVEGVSGE